MGVVVLNQEGKVTFESDLAREMINAYFSGKVEGSLPADLRNFVAAQASAFSGGDNFDPQKYLVVSNGRSELRITVAPDSQEREVLIFLEERLPQGV